MVWSSAVRGWDISYSERANQLFGGWDIRNRICKRLRSPGIDSDESIPPACVAWRASTTNRVVVTVRQPGNRFLDSLKGLQIRAQFFRKSGSAFQWLGISYSERVDQLVRTSCDTVPYVTAKQNIQWNPKIPILMLKRVLKKSLRGNSRENELTFTCCVITVYSMLKPLQESPWN
jgi:hypothetical protein